jgi:hypothetical protein
MRRAPAEPPVTLARIADSPWADRPATLGVVARTLAAPRRVLARVAGPWMMPPLSPRLATPATVRALVRALAGRLVVTNPCAAARLPRGVTAMARFALRDALDPRAAAGGVPAEAPAFSPGGSVGDVSAARDAAERRRVHELLARLPEAARAALVPGSARWGAVALYEGAPGGAYFDDSQSAPAAPEPHPLVAFVPYRLALVVGRGASPPSWDAVNAAVAAAPAVSWPVGQAARSWFTTALLLPDAVVAEAMDAPTLARWQRLTGRGGPSARDAYWFAESWERYREPGRHVGHVTPADVARPRRTAGGAARGDATGAATLTAQVERGVCVPPGYALVTCAGLLETSVVLVP